MDGSRGRRRAVTNAVEPNFAEGASMLNSLGAAASTAARGRSVIPTIQVFEENGAFTGDIEYSQSQRSRGEARRPLPDSDDSHAMRNRSSTVFGGSSYGLGLGLSPGLGISLDTAVDTLPESQQQQQQQQHQSLSPGSVFPVCHSRRGSSSLYGQFTPNMSSYQDFYGTHSPLLAPLSPMQSPVQQLSSSFNSPMLNDTSLPSSQYQYDPPLGNPGSFSYLNSPGLPPVQGDLLPRPPLSINTQGLRTLNSYVGSDGLSVSTAPEYGESAFIPSPWEYSSPATSEILSTTDDTWIPDAQFGDNSSNSNAIVDDDAYSQYQVQPFPVGEHMMLYNPNLLLPPQESNHYRRASEPGPIPAQAAAPSHPLVRSSSARVPNQLESYPQVQPQLSGHSRRRSRSRSTASHRRDRGQVGFQTAEGAPPRSPSPMGRGKRTRPLSQKGKSDASDRRIRKDICIHCKISRVKCDPSPSLWGSCGRCRNSPRKGTLTHLCGMHSFVHKLEDQTLDLRTLFSITPSVPSSSSRIRLQLPQALSTNSIHATFTNLLSASYTLIRVSSISKTAPLYDISLSGALSYLSSSSIQMSRTPFPQLINSLSSELYDGWLDCLAESSQPRTAGQVLGVLLPWTTQQGCFSYSLVSNNGIDQLLDPTNPFERETLILASQVSRLITRKVEIIGFEELQARLPDVKTKRPSTSNPPDASQVALLGRLALLLRFRSHTSNVFHSSDAAITPLEYAAWDGALRWVCKSLYSNHCWLARILTESSSEGLQNDYSTSVSLTQYPGASKTVTELMSRGESDDGFREWWDEGATIVRDAEMEAVMGEEVKGARGDYIMGGMGLFQ